MRFSLILTTKGRVKEVEELFHSLAAQTFQDFEVILSDQNDDDRLSEVVAQSALGDRLIHIKSSGGASAGRNRGLDIARGELIGFPDDDCRFPPKLLDAVGNFFDTHPEYGVLTGRSYAEDGGDGATRHSKDASVVRRLTIFQQCIEFTIFARRVQVGAMRFDENLGVGCATPWQSDEGPDLLLRLQAEGVESYYDPQFAIYHPRPTPVYDEKSLNRAYRYACGTGYFLRKHRYPLWFFFYRLARMSAGGIISYFRLQPGKAREYFLRVSGQVRGWLAMPTYSQTPTDTAPSPHQQTSLI